MVLTIPKKWPLKLAPGNERILLFRHGAGAAYWSLAQIAGLLHDSCRLEGEHAVQGTDLSLMILQDYPLDDEEKQMISKAILCHEAFSPAQQFGDPRQQILADAVYDADKFRWGPDNFSTTLWEICNYQEWSLEQILNKFPHGMEFISSIRHTFPHTSAGKIYGPEFIDLGLEMGRQMYKNRTVLQTAQLFEPDTCMTTHGYILFF